MVILFCDGYLKLSEQPNKKDHNRERAIRFLKIAQVLPLDLTMVLVRKTYLSNYDFFLSHQTEAALGRVLTSFS